MRCLLLLLVAFGRAAAVSRSDGEGVLAAGQESVAEAVVFAETSASAGVTTRVVAESLQSMYSLSDLARPVGAGDCMGLKKKMCKPCPSPEKNSCKEVEAECDNLFCSPMCLQLAWNCTVTVDKGSAAGKLFDAAMSKFEKKALCAQLVGKACQDTFKCCKKDKEMAEWVEGHSYSDKYPYPLLPIAPCLHDPADKKAAELACKNCKAAIGVSFAGTPEKCVQGGGPLPNGGGTAGGNPKNKKPAANYGGGGAHKSFEERCTALSKKITGKIPSVMSSVKEMVCTCAGCCDNLNKPEETCYFPVTRMIK